MEPGDTSKERVLRPINQTFLPSARAAMAVGGLTLLALGAALYLRYGIIQNTPIGLACEAGEQSLTCSVRLAAILLFIRSAFGWTALGASLVQILRPNVLALGVGLVSAAFGLVLYNTRLSALAVALIVLSFARRPPARR
jgi:hypothetical protein